MYKTLAAAAASAPFAATLSTEALGTVFAIMREWRGSLIAPITAHMLHNGTVTVLLLVMIRILA